MTHDFKFVIVSHPLDLRHGTLDLRCIAVNGSDKSTPRARHTTDA